MKTMIQITAVITLLCLACVIAQADCNCNSGTTAATGLGVPVVPFGAGGSFAAVNVVSMNTFYGLPASTMAVHAPHPLQADGRRYPAYPPPATAACSTSLVPIVPGTVGQTYQRKSHPLPEDKHPRAAMLAVRDRGTAKHLSVQRMSGFRMTNGVWLYETDLPLTSWTEDIVRVEARHEAEDIEPHKTKFVRLIPGRIVYLDFN